MPAALRSAWIWALVIAAGLAAVLAGPVPPGESAVLARQAALGLLGGDFGISAAQALALLAFAGWLVVKPLLVVGAILLLEFRFSPAPGNPRNYLLAWAVQALVAAFVVALVMAGGLFDLFPEPLIRVGAADGVAALLLVTLPAFLLSLLILDFFEYWVHRAQHRFAFLWRYHALHHSLDVDVLHNIRHPLDHLPMFLFVALPATFLLGVSEGQLYLLVAFTSLQGHLNHTRLPIHLGPFGRLICDNRYHFLHHSRDPAIQNRNFSGRFPLFDMIFGTYAPRPAGLVETGLRDEGPPRTLGDYLRVRLPERAPRDRVAAAAKLSGVLQPDC